MVLLDSRLTLEFSADKLVSIYVRRGRESKRWNDLSKDEDHIKKYKTEREKWYKTNPSNRKEEKKSHRGLYCETHDGPFYRGIFHPEYDLVETFFRAAAPFSRIFSNIFHLNLSWQMTFPSFFAPCYPSFFLSLIHIWRCRRSTLCRSRWSPYH